VHPQFYNSGRGIRYLIGLNLQINVYMRARYKIYFNVSRTSVSRRKFKVTEYERKSNSIDRTPNAQFTSNLFCDVLWLNRFLVSIYSRFIARMRHRFHFMTLGIVRYFQCCRSFALVCFYNFTKDLDETWSVEGEHPWSESICQFTELFILP